MVKAYLSLGSNIGNRSEFLSKAIKELSFNKKITVKKISSVYETAPVGFLDQDNFLNIAIEIKTSLDPWELMEYNQKIEEKLQRIKKIHWGPRTIDIDILLYGDDHINEENLKVPHPYMTERAFVLVPLHDIAPSLDICGKSITSYLKKLNLEEVRKLQS